MKIFSLYFFKNKRRMKNNKEEEERINQEDSEEEDDDYVPEESDEESTKNEVAIRISTRRNKVIEPMKKKKENIQEIKTDPSQINEIWQSMKEEISENSISKKQLEENTNVEINQLKEVPSINQLKIDPPKVQTETYQFAGETVKIVKEIPQQSTIKRKSQGGLEDLLSSLKKKKMSTLQKSQLDWQNYKEKEGLEDELKQATKKKDGYLDRKAFLERTEIREFERDREERLKRLQKPLTKS